MSSGAKVARSCTLGQHMHRRDYLEGWLCRLGPQLQWQGRYNNFGPGQDSS